MERSAKASLGHFRVIPIEENHREKRTLNEGKVKIIVFGDSVSACLLPGQHRNYPNGQIRNGQNLIPLFRLPTKLFLAE